MRRALLLLWLTGLWLLLWRDFSPANLLSGVAVALVVTTLYPMAPHRNQNLVVRPWRLVVFVAYFLWQVVSSNAIVARAIVSPRDRVRTGIVAIPLTGCPDLVTTVIGNSLSLTPGSLTIEVRDDPRTIYLHVLHVYDIDRIRENLHAMVRMALRALVTDAVLAEFERAVVAGPDGPAAPAEEAST